MRNVKVREVRGGFLEVSEVQVCFKAKGGLDLIARGTVVLPPILSHNCKREVEFKSVLVDDSGRGTHLLGRELTGAEERVAKEALFQAAIDGVRS